MSKTGTITVRLVKSLEFANIKQLVLHDIDLNMKPPELEKLIRDKLESTPSFAPFKSDTLKIYTQPHSFKPNNLTINLEEDDKLILQNDKVLCDQGIEDETELSYFNHAEYMKYKSNPQMKW